MEPTICGMQQFGVGIPDVVSAYNWYIRAFGVDIRITDAFGVAERMLPYTGGKPRPRRAIIAVNLQGGGGFEIWEPKDGNLHYPAVGAFWGDLGILAGKVMCRDAARAYAHLEKIDGATLLGEPAMAPYGKMHFYLYDPFGNLFEVVEDDFRFSCQGSPTGGAAGAVLGVSDMDRSMDFYARLLGYDKVLYDGTDVFPDMAGLPAGEGRFRRVLLATSKPFEGPFSGFYGPAYIELVQALDRAPVKLYEGRWWGDPGFIQICFDVRGMEGIHERVVAMGQDFVCDSGNDFAMGDTDGHFTYVEDPDGTLIEFVEAYRITISKKLGIYLDLRGRDDKKSLPRIILKALKFLRIKSIS